MTKEEMEALKAGDFVTDIDGFQWSVVTNYGKDLKVLAAAAVINKDLCHLYDVGTTNEEGK